MPTHDRVGLHDDQGRSPIPPRLGEQDPKQSIARTKVRTPDRASENPQLLTQRHVLERDGPVTTTEQPERSKQNDKRCHHGENQPVGLAMGFGEPQPADQGAGRCEPCASQPVTLAPTSRGDRVFSEDAPLSMVLSDPRASGPGRGHRLELYEAERPAIIHTTCDLLKGG